MSDAPSEGRAAPGLGLGSIRDLCSIRDLLSPDERKQLDKDLREMSAQRRRAEAAARDIVLD